MFRNLTGDGHLAGGQSSSSAAGHLVPSSGLVSQESSWIGLLSVVSRPAMSLLQKYLPGTVRHLGGAEPGASSAESQHGFVEEERDFLNQLGAMMSPQHAAPHLTFLQCEHDGSAVRWLAGAETLREIGIESAEDIKVEYQQSHGGFVSSARTLLNQVLLSSVPPEVRLTAGRDRVPARAGESKTWWANFWAGEESSQKALLGHMVQPEDKMGTDQLCPQPLIMDSKAQNTLCVRSSESTPGENSGVPHNKETPADNGSDRVQNPGQPLHISGQPAALTPEVDNGYSSLEEELILMSLLQKSEEAEQAEGCSAPNANVEEGLFLGGASSNVGEEGQQQEASSEEVTSAVVSSPQCQNKAIAFIMGCPCSDDDDSQSDDSSSSDDDDDGFDSEGSSELSDSSDEDDDEDASDSDSEAESVADRLWTSLSQSLDPYNPQNFTAVLRSSRTPPRTIPSANTATPPSSTQSSPASPPNLASTPPSSSPASLPPVTSVSPAQDSWDDSTSASEVDEAESLRLLSSFGSSDPYSPLHFQAPLRTCVPVRAAAPRSRGKRAPQGSPLSSRFNKAAAPGHRKQGPVERLSSGFSELTADGAATKKVRFCEHVEEFFASCGEEEEDRRGPWEELARDRCRFLRRCQEVEQSIAYCLQPQHRRRVFARLGVHTA